MRKHNRCACSHSFFSPGWGKILLLFTPYILCRYRCHATAVLKQISCHLPLTFDLLPLLLTNATNGTHELLNNIKVHSRLPSVCLRFAILSNLWQTATGHLWPMSQDSQAIRVIKVYTFLMLRKNCIVICIIHIVQISLPHNCCFETDFLSLATDLRLTSFATDKHNEWHTWTTEEQQSPQCTY